MFNKINFNEVAEGVKTSADTAKKVTDTIKDGTESWMLLMESTISLAGMAFEDDIPEEYETEWLFAMANGAAVIANLLSESWSEANSDQDVEVAKDMVSYRGLMPTIAVALLKRLPEMRMAATIGDTKQNQEIIIAILGLVVPIVESAVYINGGPFDVEIIAPQTH